MAKKNQEQEQTEASAEQEQLDLIDVAPENAQEIIASVKRYKKAQTGRIALLNKEVEERQKLRALIDAANLQRLEDGSIRFRVDGFIITVKPRDELITVKDENDSGED